MDVQDGRFKLDLLPAQPDEFTRPQPVTERNQDHGRIAMPVPVGFGGFDEPLDFPFGQMFAGPQFGIRATPRRYCPFYVLWSEEPQCWICHRNPHLRVSFVR